MPAGDAQIGPISYHAGRAPDAHRAHGKTLAASAPCVEGWRGLDNGPVGRQVLVTCSGGAQSATRVASGRIEPKTEHLRAPGAVRDRLIRVYSVPLDPR